MLIGAMNHPARDVLQEIEWIAGLDFDFVDLTLEPPLAGARQVDWKAIRSALQDSGLGVVGHTAYYLPLCSPFESIRRAAVEELKVCLDAFATIGAAWMNIHPDRQAPFYERRFIIEQNLKTIRDLLGAARNTGVGIMIENLPGSFNSVRQLSELLDPVPELGLHLDIGHGNLLVEHNTTDELLATYSPRLRHVHLHDNKGGSSDLHLPLGTGTIDTAHYVRALKRCGYDDTITLEVFSPDRHFLAYSRDLLRSLWDGSTAPSLAARTHEVH
ncbi:MAG TPA: sugar phosphate isomerase/epimerase family protein [Methylomirabilota bacterium]|jgi:sugar phosphate isomerase/epimerase|nr:sugar phosphate isomerase/epimerase family protein [Methylomirabilota bacterium]